MCVASCGSSNKTVSLGVAVGDTMVATSVDVITAAAIGLGITRSGAAAAGSLARARGLAAAVSMGTAG